ncbi:hypothetical protein OROHE_025017 [Orobanche hederae]
MDKCKSECCYNTDVASIWLEFFYGWIGAVTFFWGYALSQLPGGWLAKIFGGRVGIGEGVSSSAATDTNRKDNTNRGTFMCFGSVLGRVLEFGVLIWSFATAFVPLVPGFMPGLDLLKILVGIGEGVSPSASTDMIARTIPIEERSCASEVSWEIRLLLAPPLIVNYGWGSVFYIFGSLGIAWYSMFQVVKEDKLPFSASDQSCLQVIDFLFGRFGRLIDEDVPWKEFFKSKAVWAVIRTINYNFRYGRFAKRLLSSLLQLA